MWGQKGKVGPAKALAKVSKVEQPAASARPQRKTGFVTRKEAPKFFALR